MGVNRTSDEVMAKKRNAFGIKKPSNLDKVEWNDQENRGSVVGGAVDELLIVGWCSGDRRRLVCFGFCSGARFLSPLCCPYPPTWVKRVPGHAQFVNHVCLVNQRVGGAHGLTPAL